MRFLHSSDIWLGHGFPFAKAVADEFREARIQAVRELIALGQRHEVNAVVLAGNTLADNRVARYTVEDLSDLFLDCEFQVLVLPGLRDPLTPDSPFRSRSELFGAPIRILDGVQPVRVAGVDFCAFPVSDRSGEFRSSYNGGAGGVDAHVGIACVAPERFDETGLAEQEFDYLVMGGATRRHQIGSAVWSGAPEPSECGQSCGSVCLVELNQGEVSTEFLPIGSLHWLEQEWTFESFDALDAKADALSEPSRTKLDVRLSGSLSFRDLEAFDSWVERTRPRFLDLNVDYPRDLVVKDEDLYAHPLLRQVTERLLEHSAQSGDVRGGALPSEAESARWALSCLQKLLSDAPYEDLV